jgi:hypothetical protein
MNNKDITPLKRILNLPPSNFPEPKPSEFYNMQQGQVQSLIYKGINSPAQIDLFTGEGTVEEKGQKIYFKDYEDLIGKIGPTAKLLYIALSIEVANSNSNAIRLPLDKYMEMRGLKDKKTARKQVKEDLKTLASIRVEFKEKRKGKQGDFLNIRLSGGTEGIVNGVIIFNFNTDYVSYIKRSGAPPLPKGLLFLNQQNNPYSSDFLYRITNHKIMNRTKSNEDIIGVKTLLDAAPQMPKYEDIKDSGRISQRIIEPFERDMDALNKTIKWHYCGPRGEQTEGPANYEEFIAALVKITWVNPFPEMQRPPKPPKKRQPKKP